MHKLRIGEFFVSDAILAEAKEALTEFFSEGRVFVRRAEFEPWTHGTVYVAESPEFDEVDEGCLPNRYDLLCMIESGEHRFRFEPRGTGEARTVWLGRDKPKEEPLPIATQNIARSFQRW